MCLAEQNFDYKSHWDILTINETLFIQIFLNPFILIEKHNFLALFRLGLQYFIYSLCAPT